MKRLAFILMVAAALFTACTGEKGGTTGGGDLKIKADFTITPNPAIVGEEVTLAATASDGISPYTFNWEIGTDIKLQGETVKYSFDANGAYVVKLTVLDKDGNKTEKRKNLVVNPAPVAEKGEVNLLWAAKIPGYNAISTPAIADDGSIYATSQAGILFKYDKDGKELWQYDTKVGVKGTPQIDADGTVYLGAGTSNGDAKVVALNPDGTEKWVFTNFWAAEGATLAASYQGALIGIDTDKLYIGNCGTTGAVIALEKATGKRLGVVKDATGGVRAGITISKDGHIQWVGGKYGVFGLQKSLLDGEGLVGWSWRFYEVQAANNTEGPIAIAKVNGVSCVVGVQTGNTTLLPYVYAVPTADADPAKADYPKAVSQYDVPATTGQMDNGAVVVTAEGNLVASLNCTNGVEDGGIVVVNPSTNPATLVAEYRIMEKISGAAAIDAAGNIHFGTEQGNYYVVDKDCKLVAKKELAAMILADDRYKELLPFEAAKVYSSVIIGDDGKVYLQFTNNDSEKKREFGALVCLEVGGCTAPGNTDWPMMGQNRRHTNCEK